MQNSVPHQHSVRGPVIVAASLLRASVMQRLAIAAVFSAVLWAAVAWALDWVSL